MSKTKTAIIIVVESHHNVILLEDGKTVQQVEAKDRADAERIQESWKTGTYQLLQE